MKLKLFMLLLGCKPPGRLTEQHDIFFGIAESIKDLIPAINTFWPEADGKIHIDAWREVVSINSRGVVAVLPRSKKIEKSGDKLFFLNLGGYTEDVFDEQHHKLLIIAKNKGEAVEKAMKTNFYATTTDSHIDDKYGVDVDDIYEIKDILPEEMKRQYKLGVISGIHSEPDEIHLGYLKLSKIK